LNAEYKKPKASSKEMTMIDHFPKSWMILRRNFQAKIVAGIFRKRIASKKQNAEANNIQGA
jgi:hypothetical protein